jgi:hypothetical protein
MFRFTIRDVLWFMVVVALSICLLREREAAQQSAHRQLQVEILRDLVSRQDQQIRDDWDRIDRLTSKIDEWNPPAGRPKLGPGYRWKQTMAGVVITPEPVPVVDDGPTDSWQHISPGPAAAP